MVRHLYQEDNADERLSQFSLFEGDLMNRTFAKVGLGPRKPTHILFRYLILLTISYGGMAVFSIQQVMHLPPDPHPALNFFLDFAAYTQYFIGLPLFLISERIISDNILSAARDFENSGVVSKEDKPELARMEKRVGELRRAMWPEYFLIAMALYMGVMALGVEMFTTNNEMVTWHSYRLKDHPVFTRWMTPAGWYAMFIGLPIMSYVWLRTFWKVTLWYWYLKQISKFKLTLVASHPDKTGGIGFLSEVQAKFAIVILAFGISNILSTVGYKIAIENAPIDLPPVWGMVAGFVIFAPIMFLAPLLLFTKQLSRTKKRAMAQFREKAMASAVAVEQGWLMNDDAPGREDKLRDELAQLNLLTGFYERIQSMRVIPFDLRSAAQLIGSAVGPMIPLLPYFFDIPEAWVKLIEVFTKWLHF
ncbi:MAG: hypothetical protein WBK55_07185 [Alphaproteobacteria bacterium]